MAKFRRLAEVLVELGLVAPGGFHVPGEAPPGWIALAHRRAYVDQVYSGNVPDEIAREIGFPMSPSVCRRARSASAGTVLTGRLALEHGIACNTAGGSHHARHAHGAGFCVFNDVAVAIRVLMADAQIATAMVIDCDVHQGDGTADIFAEDQNILTVSIHAARNYPVRKVASDIDIALPDDTGDDAYLAALSKTLDRAFNRSRPDIVFFNAGVDPHRNDRLGRLALTEQGLERRERMVIETVRARGIPLAAVIGGGYDADIDALARRHAILHKVAATFV